MKFPVLWLSFVSVWVGIAGPHQLNSCQNLNLLKQINNKQTNKQTNKMTLSQAQTIFMPANINSIVSLTITSQLQTLYQETIQLKYDYSLCTAAPSPPKNRRSPPTFLMIGGHCTQASMLIIYMNSSYHVHAQKQT